MIPIEYFPLINLSSALAPIKNYEIPHLSPYLASGELCVRYIIPQGQYPTILCGHHIPLPACLLHFLMLMFSPWCPPLPLLFLVSLSPTALLLSDGKSPIPARSISEWRSIDAPDSVSAHDSLWNDPEWVWHCWSRFGDVFQDSWRKSYSTHPLIRHEHKSELIHYKCRNDVPLSKARYFFKV